jgi:hypothetical protein
MLMMAYDGSGSGMEAEDVSTGAAEEKIDELNKKKKHLRG